MVRAFLVTAQINTCGHRRCHGHYELGNMFMFYIFDMGNRVGLVTDREEAKEKGYVYVGEEQKEEDAHRVLTEYFSKQSM